MEYCYDLFLSNRLTDDNEIKIINKFKELFLENYHVQNRFHDCEYSISMLLPSEYRHTEENISKLQNACAVLMSDVRGDISNISDILEKFSLFRQYYPDRYHSAYIGISLPPIIGLFVKLDIMSVPILEQNVSLLVF